MFPFAGQTIGTPATRSTLRDDLQLAVLAVPDDGSTTTVLRVTVQPLVLWLWVGGAVMAVGTALAAVPGAGAARRRDGDGAEAERRSSDGVSA
jgi:cytochrome c-type biogenesis protein CcmF